MNCVALTPLSRVSRSSKPRPKPMRTLPISTLFALSITNKKIHLPLHSIFPSRILPFTTSRFLLLPRHAFSQLCMIYS